MRHGMLQQAIAGVLAATVGGTMAAEPIVENDWGRIDGRQVKLYTLTNAGGLVLRTTNYVAIITELHLPDRDGRLADVVLGHDTLGGYIAGHPYFGALVGRCANRIAGARFSLDGRDYQLAKNNGPNHLHGGVKGFDKQVYDAAPALTPEGPSIRFSRTSPDGEENYPGNVTVSVAYTLTDSGALRIEFRAETDAPTVVNLAQHTYWNLAGHNSGDILGHELELAADRYTPVDATLIPTGELAEVRGTPFDFTVAKLIGRDLAAAGGDPVGFDHNYALRGEPYAMKLVARVHEHGSGRAFELRCDRPGVQFYTGNFLDGNVAGKGGTPYRKHAGFCLETQNYPDSIHRTDWPSVVLRPGRIYRHTMLFEFGRR